MPADWRPDKPHPTGHIVPYAVHPMPAGRFCPAGPTATAHIPGRSHAGARRLHMARPLHRVGQEDRQCPHSQRACRNLPPARMMPSPRQRPVSQPPRLPQRRPGWTHGRLRRSWRRSRTTLIGLQGSLVDPRHPIRGQDRLLRRTPVRRHPGRTARWEGAFQEISPFRGGDLWRPFPRRLPIRPWSRRTEATCNRDPAVWMPWHPEPGQPYVISVRLRRPRIRGNPRHDRP